MKKSILLVAVFGFILLFTSCSKAPEVTVSKYFEAMKHQDKDTLASMALDPKSVTFKSFEIISFTEEKMVPFALPELKTKMETLNKQKNEQVTVAMDAAELVDDLKFQLEETRRREKKVELEQQIKDSEAKAELEKQKVLQLQVSINNTKDEIDKEENLAKMSTGITQNLEMYTGETYTQEVEVKVTMDNDEVKTYIFFLRKNVLKMQEANPRTGRLVITKIATTEEIEQEKNQTEEITPAPTEPQPQPTTTEENKEEATSETEKEGEGEQQ